MGLLIEIVARSLDLQVEVIGRSAETAADVFGWLSDLTGEYSEVLRWVASASKATP